MLFNSNEISKPRSQKNFRMKHVKSLPKNRKKTDNHNPIYLGF